MKRAGLVTAIVVMLLAPAMLDRSFPFPFEALERKAAQSIRSRDGQLLRLFLPEDDTWRMPVDMPAIDAELVQAVVAAEDRWFWQHPGVNPLAILRASWTNLRSGRRVSGASTIPMQLARWVEPRPRTLRAKLFESLRALQLVHHWDRERILLTYLNRVPMGGNLEGVGAAAHFYFGKRPNDLSTGEIALLVALPRAPRANDPTRSPEAARAARDRVIDTLVRAELVSVSRGEEARSQPLPERRESVPFVAPHFSDLVHARNPDALAITTTLDPRIQRMVERFARAHVETLRERGLSNVAVVVLENEGRAVRAMLGSADFFDARRQGQVNSAVARRSPGSTLKPFLYGLAFDLGRVSPESFLLDVPRDFAGYVAENYDGQWSGRTTVRDALIESLNAPAVAMLAEVGLRNFHRFLRDAGLDSLDRPSGHYGLPLVLGAGEVDLLSLTNLYAALAEDGLYRPARILEEEPDAPRRILSIDAARFLTGILKDLRRPDLPEAWQLTENLPGVAWKTGTSYGHRDAWSVGYSKRFTIGVWTGNPDGRGQLGTSGARDAAPLLFELFGALETGGDEPASAPGPRTRHVDVCAVSHDRAGPYCPRTESIPVIEGITRLSTCDHHRRIFIDEQSGARLAGRCLRDRSHHAEIFEVFPAQLVGFWRASGRSVPELPTLHASCRDVPGDAAPRIVSPSASTPYLRRAEAPLDFQRVELLAAAAPGTGSLYWYQDGELLGSTEPTRPFFAALEQGHHELVVVDDVGRIGESTYWVE